MANKDKDAEKEVTAPLSVKKPEAPAGPEAIGEDDVTAKIPRPPKLDEDSPKKPVVSLGKSNDAEPLKPKSGEEEPTAKIPKLSKAPAGAETKTDGPVAKKPDAVPLKKPSDGQEDQTAKIPKAIGDRKVVLNSATDSTIKPSDVTTMAPAIVPEMIDMKKTESGNVAVVDDIKPAVSKTATPPPIPASSSSSQGRKTIKLKPLKKDATPEAEEDNTEETLSMSRDSLMEGENIPSLGGNIAPPRPMGTIDDEATVKIQKPEMTKPAHPTPIVPGSKETIKLRPSTTPPPVGAGITQTEAAGASDADDESEETVSVSKKTIRLVPKKPGEDDATQKTPKQEAAPAAKPSATAGKPSAPTVKLKESDDVTQKTARPSAPTVKLSEEPAAPPKAAAPTAAVPAAVEDDRPAASKKTLKLKATSPAAPPPQASKEPGLPPMEAHEGPAGGGHAPRPKVVGADPGVVLTLVAILTLVLVAYYVWMVGGQWAEQYMEVQSANVPALSGKVK